MEETIFYLGKGKKKAESIKSFLKQKNITAKVSQDQFDNYVVSGKVSKSKLKKLS